jgi:hypothetical protein
MFFHRPTGRRTGWTPGSKPERIVIQAFAEDSPHSPALQVGRTAPWVQYKPLGMYAVNNSAPQVMRLCYI